MDDRIASTCKLLSDPTRLRVLELLRGGPLSVTAMCRELGTSQPAMSHSLSLLRLGGLVAGDRRGKENLYRVEPGALRAVAAALLSLAARPKAEAEAEAAGAA